MAIYQMPAFIQLPPERQHVIELAFKQTLHKLSLVDRNDPICELVARKVIQIGASGPMNAIAISEIVFRDLGQP